MTQNIMNPIRLYHNIGKDCKYIGTSFSLCVKSIIDGEIELAQVVGIESSTKIINPVDLEEVIEQYKASYWEEDPDKAEEIAREIYFNRVFYQPRVAQDYYKTGVRPLWETVETSK